MNKLEEEALIFQLDRNFAILSSNLLGILENLKKNHEINFDKLFGNLPPEFGPVVEMADYFGENHYLYYRKLILDATNGSKRELKRIIAQD